MEIYQNCGQSVGALANKTYGMNRIHYPPLRIMLPLLAILAFATFCRADDPAPPTPPGTVDQGAVDQAELKMLRRTVAAQAEQIQKLQAQLAAALSGTKPASRQTGATSRPEQMAATRPAAAPGAALPSPPPGHKSYLQRAKEFNAAGITIEPAIQPDGTAYGKSIHKDIDPKDAQANLTTGRALDAAIGRYIAATPGLSEAVIDGLWDGYPAVGMDRKALEFIGNLSVKAQAVDYEVLEFRAKLGQASQTPAPGYPGHVATLTMQGGKVTLIEWNGNGRP